MIFKSPYAEVPIPEVPVTQHVLRKADELGDKPALIDAGSGRTLTYAGLADAIARCASGLKARGFLPGDVAALLLPNMPEFAVVFHAVASIGGTVTTVSPLFTAGELSKQIEDSKATHIVSLGVFLDTAREAAQRTGISNIITIDGAPETIAYTDLLASEPADTYPFIHPKRDLAALPYSSGTTGMPKGVMLSHYNLVANMCQIEGGMDPSLFEDWDNEVLLAVLPFFHIYGMNILLNYNLSLGSTVVTMPRFDMEDFLKAIQCYRVTTAQLVPPILLGLAKHPMVDEFDLSSLKNLWCGAAPLGDAVASIAAERTGTVIGQGYGMTEVSGVGLLPKLDEAGRYHLGSVGYPVPNMEAKVVDVEAGESLGLNTEGELLMRGPNVMLGYLNREDETDTILDEDGWLHTGDVVLVDQEGRFHIVDRVKELIKYKAMQVAPAELEALLLGHVNITDAAVIGKPDEEAGEVPYAFVVANDELDAKAVMAFVAGKVAPHKRIRGVEFVDEIPKALSGKILRRMLKPRLSA